MQDLKYSEKPFIACALDAVINSKRNNLSKTRLFRVEQHALVSIVWNQTGRSALLCLGCASQVISSDVLSAVLLLMVT